MGQHSTSGAAGRARPALVSMHQRDVGGQHEHVGMGTWGKERQGWERAVRSCEGTQESGAPHVHQAQALQERASPSFLRSERSRFRMSLL